MTFTFPCPHCNRNLKSENKYVGRTSKCPNCRESVIVPAAEAEHTPETKIETEDGRQARADKIQGLSFDSRNTNNKSTPSVAPPSVEVFRELCKHGTLSEVQAAICQGADVNTRDEDDWTVLHFAARHNPDPEIIDVLVKAGVEVNARDKDGWTALFHAALKNSNPEVITSLVKAGAEVNAKIENGWTALFHAAAANSNPEIITALVKAGADVNTRSESGWTALFAAAGGNSNSEIIAALVKAGADVNTRAANDWIALFAAAQNNPNSEIITALVLAGADIHARDKEDGWTVLFYAVLNSNPEIITTLVKAGVRVNARDKDGRTALDHAGNVRNPNPEIITALKRAGAKCKRLEQKEQEQQEQERKIQEQKERDNRPAFLGGLSSVKNAAKTVSGIAVDGVGSVAKKAAAVATDEQTKKVVAEMLLYSGKHIAISIGKLVGVLVLFVVTNLFLFVLFSGNLIVVLLALSFMTYAVKRAYTVVQIDIMKSVYDQFLTPLLRQTCIQIAKRASELDAKGKKQEQVTDFLSMLPEQFGNRCPRLIRNGISFLLSRIPVSEILSNMEQVISNGSQEQYGKMLFDNIDGYIHKSIFRRNNWNVLFRILLVNVLSLLAIGIIF